MANYLIVWKLIDGDFYEQEFKGYATLQDAVNEWVAVWGMHPVTDCEEFNIIMKDE